MPRIDQPREAVKLFSALPSFAGLDSSLLEAVAGAAILRSYNEGEVVFLEGEPCAGLYIVQEGWLKSVKISTAGREQIIRFVGPGEVFNEIGVFTGGLNQATVEALEPARVWLIQRQRLLQIMDQHPRLARVLIENLARRVQHLIQLVEDLSLRSVEGRLARLLLEQSARGALSRRRWSTQAEMASRLGTVPDVLNRALRALVEEGLIAIERHRIQILDRQGLETKAMLGG